MAAMIVLGASISLQAVAAFLALRLIRITRHRLAWSLIGGAIVLIAIRRSIQLASLLTAFDRAAGAYLPEAILYLAISILLIGGIHAIGPLFTDLARTEKALERQMRFLQELIDSIPNPVGYTDAQGTYLGCNKAWEEFVGAPRGSIIGKSVREVGPAGIEGCRPTGGLAGPLGESRSFEVSVRRADGAPRDIIVNKGTFIGPDGSAGGAVAVIEDVTELKRAEAQLRQSQKMEAIGRLAGGVAHDFRNHLTIIKGFAEMLLRRRLVLPGGQEKVEQILKAADRSAALTGQLLVFSRKEVLQPRVVNLAEMVADIAKALPRLVGEDVRLHVDLCLEPCHACVDPAQFQQAILNLAANARDAMPAGGDLAIRVCPTDLANRSAAVPPGHPPGRHVAVWVRDTGSGMDAQTVSRLFEPFFTTKEVGRGTGLGLSMVHGFVRQSGGEIEVDSQLGRGSTFRMYFPRVDAAAPLSPVSAAPAGGDCGETILVVEDEPPVRLMVIESLRELGYHVLEAAGGEHALRLAEQFGGRIDLLVTDVVMPGMSGVALSKRFRALRQGIPILFLTGYGYKELSPCGIEEAQNLLVKPIQHEQLVQKVRRALDAAKNVNENPP